MNGEHKNCLDQVCEKCFDRRLTETHIGGEASAYEAVYHSLMDQAAGAFKRSQDELAQFIRGLAVDQQRIAEKLRADQKKIREGLGE